jgi:putative intracellular protease/amidase
MRRISTPYSTWAATVLWDLVDNPDAIALIESFYNFGKPVAAVCHSPPVLYRVM